MEHFFNRKPTKGYIELSKEIEKNQNNRHITDENITVPNHISKAACYVEDARDGRLANGKGKMSEKSRKIQLCFFIQTHDWWARFIYLSIVFLAILIFFEPPSSAAITVCDQEMFKFKSDSEICKNKDIIKDWEAWTLFVEFLLIMIFVTDVFMKATYMKPSVYFTKKWHKVTTFFILLFSIDWIIFTCTYYAMEQKGLRFSRPFRPVLLLTRYRELRRILETLTDMLNELLKLTCVIIAFVLFFAWLGVTLFGKTYMFTKECVDENHGSVKQKIENNNEYCMSHNCWDLSKFPFCLCSGDATEDSHNFTLTNGSHIMVKTGCHNPDTKFSGNYVEGETETYNESFKDPLIGMVRLVVLISTENYPDVMLPAFKANKSYFLYFIVFIFIGMFLLLSVLLAVIVEFWLSYLKKTNDSEKRKERLGITKAFIWIDKDQNYYIKEHSWNELILLLKKDFTKLQSHFMFQMLDWEQKGQLDVLDFLNIAEALKLHYTLKDADTAIENTEIGQFARRILSYCFQITFFGLMTPKTVSVQTISILFSFIHTILSVVHYTTIPQTYIIVRTTINTVLLLVLLSEVLLRIMASGSGFFHPLINKWEVLSISSAFIAMIGYWITWLSSLKTSSGAIEDTMPQADDFFRIVWESFILYKLCLQFRAVSGNIVFMYKVLAVLIELFFFILIIMYVFLGIGLELFAIADDGDENYFAHYGCKLGFIDPTCGLITLMQLITTSNWHSVMNSVYKASGWWAYIYFMLFYIAIDLILLDLMIAIAIEMYNAVSRQSDDSFGEQPGICFEVYEGKIPEPSCPVTAVAKPERRRSRLGSIFNTNGTSQPEPYRKLILEVTRSKKGSWRQSIITSEIFNIDSNEIDDIQRSLDKDYPGSKGKDKHHDGEPRGIEVKLLYSEKSNERMKLNKPDCKLYIKSEFIDLNERPQGKILMELNDNQSSLHFKLIFKSESKPIRGIIRNSDEVKCEDYYELDEGEFSYHGHTDDYHVYKHWRMKRNQKQNLIHGQVSFIIMTQDKPNGAMVAEIDGVQQEKQRWLLRKDEIQQNAETFGKVSPLLSWFAHRVTTHIMKDDDTDEEEEAALEEGALVKREEFRRKVYIPNEYKQETRYYNEAHKEWLNMYQRDIPETLGDSPAAVLDQVKNFMVNQTSTSGGLLAPPGSIGAALGGNRHSFTQDVSSSDDDDDDDDSDDSDDDDDDPKPGLQIAGGANKLKGLFEAIANAPERKLSSNSRKSSTSSYRSQRSNRSSRSQPTPCTKPSLIIPQVINTDHDEEVSRSAARASSPDVHPTLKTASSAPASPGLERTMPASSESSEPHAQDCSVSVGDQESDVITNV